MREAVAAAGGEPDGIEVTGALPVRTADDGSTDLSATMAPVADLVGAGVTDFRLGIRLAPDAADAEDRLAELVAAFRAATG